MLVQGNQVFDGVNAKYYIGPIAEGQEVLTRIDPHINLNYLGPNGSAELAANYLGWNPGNNDYSVVWEGYHEAKIDGPHALQIALVRRARIWIDDELVFSRWTHGECTDQTGFYFWYLDIHAIPREWELGRFYKIRVEHTADLTGFPVNGGTASRMCRLYAYEQSSDGQTLPLSFVRFVPAQVRHVPPTIQAAKEKPEQCFAWCVAIKPTRGPWEGYTSWDVPLPCPQYVDGLGNLTPALDYQPAGAVLSNIPTQLKLGAQAADVRILAPSRSTVSLSSPLPPIYLDREKLDKKWYEQAHWELFEVDPEGSRVERLLWGVGEIGQISSDDLQATVELTTLDEKANRVVGRQLHVICQHPVFAEGGCRNLIMLDGPHRPNWTVIATVLGGDKSALNVSYELVSLLGNPIAESFNDHLTNGDLEWTHEESGLNTGYRVPLRGGNLVGEEDGVYTVQLYPKLGLQYVPVPGDKVHVVVGCRHTKGDCKYFANLPNMAAQDLPGNDDLVRRTRV